MLTKEMTADFTWDFGQTFFLETSEGNYLWSDPDYGGDNHIRKYDGSYNDWLPPPLYGRSKGSHAIKDYCGEDVIIEE